MNLLMIISLPLHKWYDCGFEYYNNTIVLLQFDPLGQFEEGNVRPKVTFTLLYPPSLIGSIKQPHLNPQEGIIDTYKPISLYCRSY